MAFRRISTDARAFPNPCSVREAASPVSDWLAWPTAVPVSPGERHWTILQELLSTGQARGALVSDAHLAPLALERGAVLRTTDRDFLRFRGVTILNPLASEANY
ncbi:MAG: hypothetical protein NZM33_11460 [Bryobacteraceae bacterium]|nr:hypothetical protein [Bryobacteraceae bacterium]